MSSTGATWRRGTLPIEEPTVLRTAEETWAREVAEWIPGSPRTAHSESIGRTRSHESQGRGSRLRTDDVAAPVGRSNQPPRCPPLPAVSRACPRLTDTKADTSGQTMSFVRVAPAGDRRFAGVSACLVGAPGFGPGTSCAQGTRPSRRKSLGLSGFRRYFRPLPFLAAGRVRPGSPRDSPRRAASGVVHLGVSASGLVQANMALTPYVVGAILDGQAR